MKAIESAQTITAAYEVRYDHFSQSLQPGSLEVLNTKDGERPLTTMLENRPTPLTIGLSGAAAWPYNRGMPADFFSEMKAYVGFTDDDARLLNELQAPLRPHFADIVRNFYDVLFRDARARTIVEAATQRVERLRASLTIWLEELFCGVYDEAYFERHTAIGRTHVRVKLPQSYMFTAMTVIRLDLLRRVRELNLPDFPGRIAALHKLLDLELAIMNEAYSDDLLNHMREIEQRGYEQRLSESEHLATIGQLAASLAHEIKNPLAGISGAIQVLGAALDNDHPHQEVIQEVLKQIDRLDSAVKDLLVYGRPKPPEKSPVNLSHTLDRLMLVFREEPAFRRVKIICRGIDVDHEAEVDETQMQQVIYNLLLNAAHACESGGIVICSLMHADGRLKIVVEDNGIGIPRTILTRVFEPFFTTKAKGTGLGLPICRRIVALHGGTLEVESEVGRGTRVTVEIPSKS